MTGDARVEAAALVIAHADGYAGSDVVPSGSAGDAYRHQARKVLAAADAVVTRDNKELREAATQAIMDALSWMDPATAMRYTAEPSYQRVRAALEVSMGARGVEPRSDWL